MDFLDNVLAIVLLGSTALFVFFGIYFVHFMETIRKKGVYRTRRFIYRRTPRLPDSKGELSK